MPVRPWRRCRRSTGQPSRSRTSPSRRWAPRHTAGAGTARRWCRCECDRWLHSLAAAVFCCCCFSLLRDFLPPQLDGLISSYRSACLSTGAVANGWPASVYGLSKAAVIALTRILGRDATNGGEEHWPARARTRGSARVVRACACWSTDVCLLPSVFLWCSLLCYSHRQRRVSRVVQDRHDGRHGASVSRARACTHRAHAHARASRTRPLVVADTQARSPQPLAESPLHTRLTAVACLCSVCVCVCAQLAPPCRAGKSCFT